MPTDREEAATGANPASLDAEMGQATRRLRQQAWMIKPLTDAPILAESDLADARAQT